MGFLNFFNRIPSLGDLSFFKSFLPSKSLRTHAPKTTSFIPFTFAAPLPFIAFPAFNNSIFSFSPWNNSSSQVGCNSDNQIYNSSPFSYNAEELKNKWKKKKPKLNLSNAFFNKVVEIAKRIECDPNDLMGIMNSESGLNPAAVNRFSNATGLIQFMPSTARAFNTSVSALRNMSAERQLDYVEKYLISNKKSAGLRGKVDAGTLYTLVFLPAFAKREVLCHRGDKYYGVNKGLDRNRDGRITKTELGNRVKSLSA